jgi:hypothetical protein
VFSFILEFLCIAFELHSHCIPLIFAFPADFPLYRIFSSLWAGVAREKGMGPTYNWHPVLAQRTLQPPARLPNPLGPVRPSLTWEIIGG